MRHNLTHPDTVRTHSAPPSGRRRRAAAALAFALAASLAQACPWCGGDTAKINEDTEIRALVPVGSATHTAVQDGAWSSPATWGGSVPGETARVVVPAGRSVTYDVNSTTNIQWLRIDGTLRFRTDVTTALAVDTIVLLDTGTWEQGTVDAPISATVNSTVTFTDIHPISDPMKLGRGLLTKGRVRIHGAVVSPYVQTTGALANGATTASLLQTATGWKSGDTVVVSALRMNSQGQPMDEVRTLSAATSSSITWTQGLGHARVVEFADYGLTPYIANHTRNVLFRSANTSQTSSDFPTKRGHVMFMHNPDVDVRYAAFHNLGRTRKDVNVTNGVSDPYNPGDNPRGRYAVHFHRNGKDDLTVTPSVMIGCSVLNPSSWAYVNHDAFVHFEDNVAHNSFGAAFITENGGEIGRFLRNLSTTCKGRGFIKDGTGTHDLAVSGIGFWFQGANVEVEENVAMGSVSAGFSLFQRTKVDLGDNSKVYRQNLLDFEASGGNDYIQASETPLTRFWGNVSIANYHGVYNVDNEINGLWPTTSILDDHTDLNSMGFHAVRIEYYRNFTFRDTTVLRDASYPADSWSGGWAFSANHLVDHLYPWQTRATDRWDSVLVKGLTNAVDNDDGQFPDRIAKQEVIENSLQLVSASSGSLFANTSTMSGEPLVRYTPRNAVMNFPTFLPIAGRHLAAVQVTITKPANASASSKLYYVTGGTGWSSPSVEDKLQSGQWTEYTGPITISTTSKLIAICVDESVTPWRYSRIRNGVYTIASNSPVAAAVQFSPNGGAVTADMPITLSTSTTGASIRYTTDGSDPRISTQAKIIPSGRMLGLSAGATVRAFAYVSGHVDSALSSATFTVGGTTNTAPTISAQPVATQTKTVGESVSFSVTASGTPTPTFQWRKDGTNISGATGSSYTISSVQTGDAGTYTVVVTNSVNSVTSSDSVLTVTTPPATTNTTLDMESLTGGTNTLTSGDYTLKGFTSSGAAEAISVYGTSNGYASKVLHPNNYSGRITLERTDGAAFTLVSFGYAEGIYGDNGDVIVTATKADGTTLTTAQLAFTNKTLTTATLPSTWTNLTKVTFDWAGSGSTNSAYGAIDSIVVGSDTPPPANTAPTISAQPEATQTKNVGESVTFSVTASGTPTPTFQWRKDGTNISGATSSSYTISSVQTGDAGTYTVVVTNSVDSVTSSGSVLTVNTPPPTTDTTLDMESLTGGANTLTSGSYTLKGFNGSGVADNLSIFGTSNGYASKVLHPNNYSGRITLERTDGAAFTLVSFGYAEGRYGDNGDVIVTATKADGTTLTTAQLSFTNKTLTTSTLPSTWTNLTKVTFNWAGSGSTNTAYGVIDNVVVR
jgi:hypothetical protein